MTTGPSRSPASTPTAAQVEVLGWRVMHGDGMTLAERELAGKIVLERAEAMRSPTPSEKAKPESEEAKALIADAARYRWLKNAADVDVMDEILMQKIEEWDSLIDTQIAFDGVVPVRPERPESK